MDIENMSDYRLIYFQLGEIGERVRKIEKRQTLIVDWEIFGRSIERRIAGQNGQKTFDEVANMCYVHILSWP